ncbi:MAG: hypothetical protein ACM30I_10400 [Gemmatimonas sp.]
MTDSANIFIAIVAAILFVVAWRKGGGAHIKGLRLAFEHTVVNMPRVFFALLAAGFIGEILPKDVIASWLGHESGVTGIMIATAVGTIMPGGPIIAFPIVVALSKSGAGFPALVTFLTSWSLLGLQRVFAFELPMMGHRFVINRMTAAFILTPLTGFAAWLTQMLLGMP